MARARRLFYRNILGDTKKTLEAIQRFIDQDDSVPNNSEMYREESPAESVNRVINSVLNEDVANEIEKIIKDL